MKTAIVYPLPFDAWQTFSSFVQRFAETFKQFPPGADYELYAMGCWGEPTDYIRQWFYGIKTKFVPYYEHGCDIGSAQTLAATLPESFVLAMTTRCYFHREGWLRRYMEAREKHGPGLYGASASWEGGKPHICTRAYAMDAELWNEYPYKIDTREKGQRFEVGDWCVTEWIYHNNLPLVQVTWDRELLFPDWRPPEETGLYRRGLQNAMLIWDKHTDAYQMGSDEEKQRLQKLADPPTS